MMAKPGVLRAPPPLAPPPTHGERRCGDRAERAGHHGSGFYLKCQRTDSARGRWVKSLQGRRRIKVTADECAWVQPNQSNQSEQAEWRIGMAAKEFFAQ